MGAQQALHLSSSPHSRTPERGSRLPVKETSGLQCRVDSVTSSPSRVAPLGITTRRHNYLLRRRLRDCPRTSDHYRFRKRGESTPCSFHRRPVGVSVSTLPTHRGGTSVDTVVILPSHSDSTSLTILTLVPPLDLLGLHQELTPVTVADYYTTLWKKGH